MCIFYKKPRKMGNLYVNKYIRILDVYTIWKYNITTEQKCVLRFENVYKLYKFKTGGIFNEIRMEWFRRR